MKIFKNLYKKNSQFKAVILMTILIVITFFVISFFSVYLNNSKKNSEFFRIVFSQTQERIVSEYKANIDEVKLIARNFATLQSDNNEISENYIKQLLGGQSKIKGVLYYRGNVSSFDKENVKSEIDTLKDYLLTSFIKKGIKIIRTEDFNNFKFNQEQINSQIFNNQVIISEPFRDINEKESMFLYSITAPLQHKKDNVIGFVTINFLIDNNVFFPDFLKSSGFNFLLLSQGKNIIADNINEYNIGKNILSLSGKDNFIYDIAASEKVSENKGNATILFDDSNSKLQLLGYFEKGKSVLNRFIIFFLFASLIVLIVSYIVLRYVFAKTFVPLKKIVKISQNISRGIPDKINTDNLSAEYSETGENLNKISARYKEIEKVSDDIIKENSSEHIPAYSGNDLLAKSINAIIDYLKNQKQQQLKKEEETSRQLWMRKGRFEISEAERISAKNTEELSYNLTRSVVNYVDALMGGIYYYDKKNNNIELLGAYAYEKDRHFNVNFKPGEGIVGACVLEKKKILLDHIPEDYIKIATGLGTGSPSYIAVIPIFFKKEINAVIEIAFMNKPEDYKIEFIEQLGDNIGAWIDASIIRSKTEELLEISQKQTQELAEKEDELNKKVTELQEIQEKTAEINTRYESILNAVNQTIMTVEYTLDGTIINCNSVYTDIMGFEPEDIKGKNVSELVKDQSESLKQIIEEVKTGKTIKKEVKRYTKDGKEKTLTATYTPYFDNEGKISQILFFAFDISNINN